MVGAKWEQQPAPNCAELPSTTVHPASAAALNGRSSTRSFQNRHHRFMAISRSSLNGQLGPHVPGGATFMARGSPVERRPNVAVSAPHRSTGHDRCLRRVGPPPYDRAMSSRRPGRPALGSGRSGMPAASCIPVAHGGPDRARLFQVVRLVRRSTRTSRTRPGRAEPARREAHQHHPPSSVDGGRSILDSLAHGVEIAEGLEELYGPPRGVGGESERSLQ